MKTRMMLVGIVIGVLPQVAVAQAGSASAAAGASAAAQAGTPQARIDAALNTAASAGIPAELVESKIAEGRAKAVAEERIAAAVEARVAALVRASEAMRSAGVQVRNAGELAITADALEAGVNQNALVRISREAPAERRSVAVAVLADLVRLGHPSEQAATRVGASLASSAALANLHAEVATQLRLGGLQPTLDASGVVRIR